MIYSSTDPQFVRVSCFLKGEKNTPHWLGYEAVDDFSAGKSPSVAVPQGENKELPQTL